MRGSALLDMDGTLLEERTIDVFSVAFGKTEELRRIEKRAVDMLEYEVTQEIARLFSEVKRGEMERVFESIPLNLGVEDFIDFLRDYSFRPVIVTDSYQFLADLLAERLGIELAYGNQVEFYGDIFTGRLILRYPCMKMEGCREYSICKLRVLLEIRDRFDGLILAVGDGGSDICMIRGADIGVAYRPKSEELRRIADITVYSFEKLKEKLMSRIP